MFSSPKVLTFSGLNLFFKILPNKKISAKRTTKPIKLADCDWNADCFPPPWQILCRNFYFTLKIFGKIQNEKSVKYFS